MQKEMKELMARKDEMEAKLHELQAQIKRVEDEYQLDKGTVDAEGFPRADLDFGGLATYKSLKKAKAELNNDHLALMKQIEKKLVDLHKEFPEIDPAEREVLPKEEARKDFHKKPVEQPHKMQQQKPHNVDYLTPFAKLTHVDNDSPASKAGLKTGDLLSEFSDVTIYSIDYMKEIPKHVQDNRPIKVVVMREVDEKTKGEGIFLLKDGKHYQKVALTVTPSFWQGRGLLGCKIDPLIE